MKKDTKFLVCSNVKGTMPVSDPPAWITSKILCLVNLTVLFPLIEGLRILASLGTSPKLPPHCGGWVYDWISRLAFLLSRGWGLLKRVSTVFLRASFVL